MQEIELDVTGLAPPEPMTKILTALSVLEDSQYLKVVHRRQPFPLYEKLKENGFSYQVKTISQSRFFIYICLLSQAGALATHLHEYNQL